MRYLLPTLATAACLTIAPATAQETQEERDVGFIQGLIEDNLSGVGRQVIIEGFEGALSSRATIDVMTIADEEGIWLRAEGLTFDWTRSALLSGQIDVQEMSADVIEFIRPPVSEPAPPNPEATPFEFALPELPVGIEIDSIEAGRIILGAPLLGEELAFNINGTVQLSGGEGSATITARRLDGADGQFEISGAYSNSTRVLDLTVDLSEAEDGIVARALDLPGDPSVQLSLAGTAPIDDYAADLRIATADIERITGSFGFVSTEAGQDVRFDISGDVNALIETDYGEFFGPNVRLAMQGSRDDNGALSLSQLAIEARSITLQGSAQIGADGWPETLALDGRIAASDGSPVLLPTGDASTFVTEALIDLGFDASAGDRWTLSLDATDFTQPGLALPTLSLNGSGLIRQGNDTTTSLVDGTMTYAARGLRLSDPALTEALGADITGDISFEKEGDQPFRLSNFTLTGPGVELAADATVSTTDTVEIDTNILLEAQDLGRFGALTGVDLSGAAELVVVGNLKPLDGMFDLTLVGNTTDLGLGVAQIDPLLAGDGALVLRTSRDTEGTRIEELDLSTAELTATGTADITSTVSTADFDLRIRDVAVSLPDLAGPGRLTGTANIAPDMSATLDSILTLPGTNATITADAAASDAGGLVTLDISAAIDDLAPYADIAGQDIGGAANLTVTGTSARDATRFDLDIAAQTEDLATGVAQLDPLLAGTGTVETRLIRVNADALRLEALALQTPQLTLDADASLTLGDLVTTLDLRLNDLGDVLPQLSGSASLAGTLSRNAHGIVDADLTATGPGGARADVDAMLDTSLPGLAVDGTVAADIARLSAYSDLAGQDLGGSLSASITGTATDLLTPMDTVFDADFDLSGTNLSGFDRSLRDRLTMTGTAARTQDGTLSLATRASGPGSAELELDATLDATGLITGDLAANIGSLAPYSSIAQRALSGQIVTEISGTARSDFGTFDLSGTLQGSDLSVAGTQLIGGLDLSGSGSRTEDGETDIRIGGSAPGNTTLALTADGTDRLQTNLDLSVGTLSAYQGIIGRPLSGALRADIYGTVQPTDAAFDLTIDAQTQNLDPGIAAAAALLRGTGTITGQVRRDVDGSLAAQGLQVRYPNITADADLASRGNGGNGTFDVRIADVGLFIDDFSGPATARGTAQLLDNGGYRLDVAATGPGSIAADIAGTVAPGGALDLDVNGTAPLGIANSFIEPRRISGTAGFDLSINGPPSLDAVSGTVRISDGRLAAPSFNQALENIGGTIQLTGSTAQLNIEANLQDGGRLAVSGPFGLTGGRDADLRVIGEGLILRDPTLYETSVDLQIAVTGPFPNGGRISGDINLGATEIQVPSSTASALGTLPQVTHIGAPTDVRQTLDRAGLTLGGVEVASEGSGRQGNFGLDLRINAPARVFIRGRGLDAELGGQLRITGTTAQVIPIGEFQLVRGRIDILEQRFELDEGGAFLQGDFDPFIRLVATTTARDGTQVSIIVEGPATEPEVRFESSPQLPQDEVLSRLIFGRDLSEISPIQAIQLAAAVSTLAGRSSGGLLSEFRQGLGLDDFDITTDDDGNAAVRAGAYLSDNIYTDVTVGSENTEINLNLDLTDSITVTGSAGSDGETSIGIFFERDY